MMIERLLRKLAPLMPDRVRRWRRNLDLVDHEMRVLIERQILVTAHDVLGDFRDRLLLSLPPRTRIRGPIHLGLVLYEKPRWPAGLDPKELTQNLAIFGRSGAGKTNVAFHLLEQLHQQRIPFLFLDWKRTARHLLPSFSRRVRLYTPGRALRPFPFNPFIPPPGMEARVYAGHVIDVLGDAYTLGDAARSVLTKALGSLYADGKTAPHVDDVLDRVHTIPDGERVRGWKASATRALEGLQQADLARGASQEEVVTRLLDQSAILELDALSAANKAFLLPLLCLWVYSVKLADRAREELRLVILVEEAHHLLYRHDAKRESLMEMLLRQCRELGIGMIVVDQHPHLISSAALGNTYTSICLNLKDPRDITKAGALCLLDDEQRRHLSMLPVGQGIVKMQDRWKHPFVVRFPLVRCAKGAVTDEMLREEGEGRLSVSRRARKGSLGPVADSRVADALTPDELSLLEDIIACRDDGVDTRYRRLGVSADKGNRLKHGLLRRGYIEEQRVNTGKTNRVLLRVTARAPLDGSEERGSLAHEYWKRWYAAQLEARGYTVQREAPRNTGWVDVLAQRQNETIAIEVETGKSNAVKNVREDLLSGFRRILVIATTPDAYAKMEEQLGAAGLLSHRVTVVLREHGLAVIQGWRPAM